MDGQATRRPGIHVRFQKRIFRHYQGPYRFGHRQHHLPVNHAFDYWLQAEKKADFRHYLLDWSLQ